MNRVRLNPISDIVETGDKARQIKEELRRKRPDLFRDPEIREMLDRFQRRAKRAQLIQNIAPGHKIEVAQVDGRTSRSGWVFKKGYSPIHVDFSLLDRDDSLPAKRTTFHELTHLLTPRDLELEESFRPTLEPIFKHLGLPDEAWEKGLDTPFIEGYVEGKTIARFGRDEKVLYTNREVPFVERLEVLGQELLGVSFKSMFFNWDIEGFRKNLIVLAWMLKSEARA
jgi:hypothetical protein